MIVLFILYQSPIIVNVVVKCYTLMEIVNNFMCNCCAIVVELMLNITVENVR